MGDVSQGAEPNLRVPDCPALERLLAHAEKVEFATGTAIFRPQTPCSKFLWVLDGSVRVCMHSADGREITLYRMGPNEPCLVCLSNLILGIP
ncbi:MAG TPA: cyclic nucleotide-binding domain-containing protein, partial [Candidatus Binatia bacterium]|nr:cyclic nucleotide-binding domain-containing protein [Candidatus Binatia bacterium]